MEDLQKKYQRKFHEFKLNVLTSKDEKTAKEIYLTDQLIYLYREIIRDFTYLIKKSQSKT